MWDSSRGGEGGRTQRGAPTIIRFRSSKTVQVYKYYVCVY